MVSDIKKSPHAPTVHKPRSPEPSQSSWLRPHLNALCPLSLDFVTDLSESSGNTVTLVTTDHFSCSLRLITLLKLPTAFRLAELLLNYVFRYFRILEDMISDQGLQFTSRVWASFMTALLSVQCLVIVPTHMGK